MLCGVIMLTVGMTSGLGHHHDHYVMWIYFKGGIRVGRLSWSATRSEIVKILVSGSLREEIESLL